MPLFTPTLGPVVKQNVSTPGQIAQRVDTPAFPVFWVTGGVYVLLIGINNLIAEQGSGIILSEIQRAMGDAAAAGMTRIVSTLPACGILSAGMQAERLALNAALLASVGVWSDACIDFAANAFLSNPTDPVYFQPDQLHLTAAGYGVMAAVAAPIIDPYL